MINTLAERQTTKKETVKMTKEEIKSRIAKVDEELRDIEDELAEIEEEESPWEGTPQSHIDYLNEMHAELLAEYNHLQGQLSEAAR